jgi:hypothetical protein
MTKEMTQRLFGCISCDDFVSRASATTTAPSLSLSDVLRTGSWVILLPDPDVLFARVPQSIAEVLSTASRACCFHIRLVHSCPCLKKSYATSR